MSRFILQSTLSTPSSTTAAMKFLLPAAIALAAATAHAEDFCGSTDKENGKVEVGAYKIVNNNWAVAGKQCTGVDWSETTTIAWHTSYNITGDQRSEIIIAIQ
ncbi:uncharacterized protein PITG_11374 [Phytophthora infestans T30-4]|uniref:Uncharacterized protein n=1 Tax=Phytophthora infestans (strain T30-4) TaxID=403677 RepID=D0NIM7_PHYIT|nr:uncharacterized protein PITG_11374 [Phytophthora infestans T30-4]EEY59361.1 hypothetical protein PITG_11374 [Phytophthora infestans T30-4]|eukprot:XP_002900971.1 hypothetical protein PITG_11374 [Phytophthora infestans T30-4]